ncbi:hypothetical protein [Synechococcus sp. MU1625]|uniref:hypothetical protein n=1 Tax=Synechococcus sp. MU1625 TaxID=2508347 RepID=UPI001CF8BB77|nr:hypothetical protein [Synechococcus sp. MU1625]
MPFWVGSRAGQLKLEAGVMQSQQLAFYSTSLRMGKGSIPGEKTDIKNPLQGRENQSILPK